MPARARRSSSLLIASAAVVLACSVGVGREATIGFVFEPSACAIPEDAGATFPELTAGEATAIQQRARAELAGAFSGLRIRVSDDRRAFWRVQVVRSLPVGKQQALPKAGESLALGMLGGTGAVGFDVVARNAIRYAPAGATRQMIVDGIGRGVGRVAIHEFAHQMLGAANIHDAADQDSYEYPSPERSSQYYGDLHWTTAWPLLQAKFGT